ncbi:MAG: hypothetical protein Q9227_006729 [Pyrenula ochraceoflavens]
MASSILSQTLQSVTVTKIEELAKQREYFEQCKADVLRDVDETGDPREKVAKLLNSFKDVDCFKRRDPDAAGKLRNIERWQQQSQYDSTVPLQAVQKFENTLRSILDIESRRFEFADLYARLLTEWIGSPGNGEPEPAFSPEDSSDSFEMVESIQKERLEQLREKFEKVVFEPLETNENDIEKYLSGLFQGDAGEKALKQLRGTVSWTGESMLEGGKLFDEQSLKWCVKALLKNELLNDDKKATLREFLKDEAVMNEIRDVLNMRFANLKNWSWGLGDKGMPVVPRQSLNGKWRVMMDDDVLQALLTHWIGTKWAVALKAALKSMTQFSGIWKRRTRLPSEEQSRKTYFQGINWYPNANESVEAERQRTYRDHFFLAPLPSKLFEEAGGYDDDDDVPESDPNKKSPKDIKQLLLRTLATEVLIRRSLDGEVAVVQSDFQWFATGIAHTSIFAVLRFLGFQEEWISFFKKALEPPLDMLTGEPVRIRKRGLPMAHVFEKFIGEIVLFFMDLAVNQESRMLLYRFHDDLWLCGSPARCAKAWQSMERFAKVMGLEFNKHKTGSVYLSNRKSKDSKIAQILPEGPVSMNFLTLDANSGQWVINQEHVQEHVGQLQKQLVGSKSVLEWIKTWNSCIGRFFSYTFGEAANCFGRGHLDTILQTHQKMQAFLFKGTKSSNAVTEHLKSMILSRFNVSDIPDSFLLAHESLGGLALRNPFIPLFLVRDTLIVDPQLRIQSFFEEEQKEYQNAKTDFESQTKQQRWRRYREVYPKEDEEADRAPGIDEEPSASTVVDPGKPSTSSRRLLWENAQSFWSFEEFIQWRECSSGPLYRAYQQLMAQPEKEDIVLAPEVERAWKELQGVGGSTPFTFGSSGAGGDVADKVDSEAAWTVQYHADEMFEKFGGIQVLDMSFLPLGVLKALKSRKVTWQMVL